MRLYALRGMYLFGKSRRAGFGCAPLSHAVFNLYILLTVIQHMELIDMPTTPSAINDALLEQRLRTAILDMLGLNADEIDNAIARLAGNALVDIKPVSALTGLSASNIYRRIKDAADPFPRPIRVDHRSLWVLSEVRQWIEEQVAAYRGQKVAA